MIQYKTFTVHGTLFVLTHLIFTIIITIIISVLLLRKLRHKKIEQLVLRHLTLK